MILLFITLSFSGLVITKAKLNASDMILFFLCFVIALLLFTLPIHEYSHALGFRLTGVTWKVYLTYCEALAGCQVSRYKYVCLAPLFTLLASILLLLLLNKFFPGWLFYGLLLGGISSFPGITRDIYWFFQLTKLDNSWIVFDHGKYADVFPPNF